MDAVKERAEEMKLRREIHEQEERLKLNRIEADNEAARAATRILQEDHEPSILSVPHKSEYRHKSLPWGAKEQQMEWSDVHQYQNKVRKQRTGLNLRTNQSSTHTLRHQKSK